MKNTFWNILIFITLLVLILLTPWVIKFGYPDNVPLYWYNDEVIAVAQEDGTVILKKTITISCPDDEGGMTTWFKLRKGTIIEVK